MNADRPVAVYGASGHTGRFVVAELHRRGWTPILSGRDADALAALAADRPGSSARAASVDDPAALDRALTGAAAVINCAGPFAETAVPVIEAALRARIPYLDIAAEVEITLATFEHYGEKARDAGVVILPSMAFYGGLGDLLATAAMSDGPAADRITIAYALSSWKPTPGTRATIQTSRQRRGGRRLVFAHRQLEYRETPAAIVDWPFPPPLGTQPVVTEFLTADSVTLPRHLETAEILTYMTAAPLADLTGSDEPGPSAVDDRGRSSQTFMVDVRVRSGSKERRATATGRDIYAISAPLVVEALERVLSGACPRPGVLAAGAAFDAREFLESLQPDPLSLQFQI